MPLHVIEAYESEGQALGLVAFSTPSRFVAAVLESKVVVAIHTPGKPPRSFYSDWELAEPRQIQYGELVPALRVQPGQLDQSQRRDGRSGRTRAWVRWVAWAALVALFASIAGLGLTGTLSLRVVETGSMRPGIQPGDVIVTVSQAVRRPTIGDVVVYTGRTFDGKVIAPFAHRIVGGDAKTGWVVKGDANPSPDTQRPLPTDITGVMVGQIPGVGGFLNLQSLIMLGLIVAALWLLLSLRGSKR